VLLRVSWNSFGYNLSHVITETDQKKRITLNVYEYRLSIFDHNFLKEDVAEMGHEEEQEINKS
jgi:hypothetical protein